MPAGRPPITLNMAAVLADEATGMNVAQLAVKYSVSAPTMYRKIEAARSQGIIPAEPYQQFDSISDSHPVPTHHMPLFGRGLLAADKRKGNSAELYLDGQFDVFYQAYRDWLGWFKEPDEQPVEMLRDYPGEEQMSVVAGDFHVPYHNDDAVRWMIKRTAMRANRIIIGGDLADMFTFSRYQKNKVLFSMEEELKRTQAMLVALSDAYPEVILLRGNHDDRFIKYFQRMGLEPEAIDALKYLHGEYAMHPIYLMAHKLRNVKIVEPLNKDFAEFCYLYQHGDCVVSHAEKYSQIPNKTVNEVISRLMSYHVPENVLEPFRVVIQCHTHQAGKTWGDYGKVGIENGCMALTPDYAGGPRNLPRRASIVGYTELYQTDGTTDLQKTNFIPYKT